MACWSVRSPVRSAISGEIAYLLSGSGCTLRVNIQRCFDSADNDCLNASSPIVTDVRAHGRSIKTLEKASRESRRFSTVVK